MPASKCARAPGVCSNTERRATRASLADAPSFLACAPKDTTRRRSHGSRTTSRDTSCVSGAGVSASPFDAPVVPSSFVAFDAPVAFGGSDVPVGGFAAASSSLKAGGASAASASAAAARFSAGAFAASAPPEDAPAALCDDRDARRVANDARATGSEGSGARRLPASPDPAASLPVPPNATGAPNASSAATSAALPSRRAVASAGMVAVNRRNTAGSTRPPWLASGVLTPTKRASSSSTRVAPRSRYSRTGGRQRAPPRGAPRGGSAITTRVAPRFAVQPGSPVTRASGARAGVAHTRRSGARIECASNAKPSAKTASSERCPRRADSPASLAA